MSTDQPAHDHFEREGDAIDQTLLEGMRLPKQEVRQIMYQRVPPATGPDRFCSTSSVRRRATRGFPPGTEQHRSELRAARSHLGRFREGDRVVVIDSQGYAREGSVSRSGRADGQFGSWESYALHVDCGNHTEKVDSHRLATGDKGIRSHGATPPSDS